MNEVTIVEVSPRDGLQNEGTILSTDAKVELITRLVDAGARRIEAVSFAHPRLVPTMADAEAVMERVPRRDDVSYAGLILNRKGLDRAVGTGVDEVNVVVCVSDTLQRPQPERHGGQGDGDGGGRRRRRAGPGAVHHDHARDGVRLPVRGRGRPGAGRGVRPPVRRLGRAGAVPGRHRRRRGAEPGHRPDGPGARPGRRRCGEGPQLRFHFHNTRNTGFANAYAAVAEGVDVLDASAGGIGGCPFAPKATGNIATDDLVYMLERMGRPTGIDLKTLIPTAGFLGEQLGHEVPALLPRAGLFP